MERQLINGVPSFPPFHPPQFQIGSFFVILVLDSPHPGIAPPSTFATFFCVSDSICLSKTIPHSLLFFPPWQGITVWVPLGSHERDLRLKICFGFADWMGESVSWTFTPCFFQRPRFYPTKPNGPRNALAATLDSRAHRFHLQPSPPSGHAVFRSHRWGGRFRPQRLPPEEPDPAVGECAPASLSYSKWVSSQKLPLLWALCGSPREFMSSFFLTPFCANHVFF